MLGWDLLKMTNQVSRIIGSFLRHIKGKTKTKSNVMNILVWSPIKSILDEEKAVLDEA